ncbi:hypothetical protein [Streptomyces sp. b94]
MSAQCLASALELGQTSGVWGGTARRGASLCSVRPRSTHLRTTTHIRTTK